jgi:hypothetical protein
MQVDAKVREGETKAEYRKRMYTEMRAVDNERRDKLRNGEIKVVMDVDDFGFLMPGYEDLMRLKRMYPNFKITAFTIPFPHQFFYPGNRDQFTTEKYKKWAKIVREHDWIEIGLHGLYHVHRECEGSYAKMMTLLTACENMADELGLPHAKIFKAPYWQYSYDALVALKDRGYLAAIDRNHPRPTPRGLDTYLYNWSLEEPIPDAAIVKGHGHFTGRNTNNLNDALANVMHYLPKETQFMTIGEYYAQHGTDQKGGSEELERQALTQKVAAGIAARGHSS